MGAYQGTSSTLKPNKDTALKISNIITPFITLIIYRIISIGSLSFFLYKTHTELVLDRYQYRRLGFIFDILALHIFCGQCYGRKYNVINLAESGSRQAWLDTLNSNIETWVKGNGPGFRFLRSMESEEKDIQCEKQIFAAYLAGSYQGRPRHLSLREARYQLILYSVYIYIVLRLACADVLPVVTQFIMWIFIFLLLPTSFLFGRQLTWYMEIGRAVVKIIEECKSTDMEKGEDAEEQLEWWIKSILDEESDSDALAEEKTGV